ncbi:MAG: hypothetical protein WA941_07630 [Nitrososphaeraceae archaeon]
MAQRSSVFDNIDDWGLIIDSRREAATSDQMLCGLVVAEFKDAIVVLNFDQYRIHKFLIPKSKVDGFDGIRVHLKISQTSLFLFCY